MANEENFDKIFSEITSPENIGAMPDIVRALSLNSARDYSLFMAELLTTVQEVNLIILNLTEPGDEPFAMPVEAVKILESLYSNTKDFNNFMIDLDEEDSGYFLYIDEENNGNNDDDRE
jgi:hypothetical protein